MSKDIESITRIVETNFKAMLNTETHVSISALMNKLLDDYPNTNWSRNFVMGAVIMISTNKLWNTEYTSLVFSDGMYSLQSSVVYLDSWEHLQNALLEHTGKTVTVGWNTLRSGWREYKGLIQEEVNEKGFIGFYTTEGFKQIYPKGLEYFKVNDQKYQLV